MKYNVFYINLDRLSERSEHMARQIKISGLEGAQRFSAFDAKKDDLIFSRYRPHNWSLHRWEMSRSLVACFESHRYLWEIIENSGYPGVILEDDVFMSKTSKSVISELAKHSDQYQVVKLDSVGKIARLGPKVNIGNLRLHEITHVTQSAAAYIVSPRGANSLLQRSVSYCDSPDDFITRPEKGFNAYQLWPGISVQGMFSHSITAGNSNIVMESERTKTDVRLKAQIGKGPHLYRLKKEIKRFKIRAERMIYKDRQLINRGGIISVVPLESDLPDYST